MTLLRLGPDDLDAAASMLAAGDVVAVPTDTVYGLAASLRADGAVATLFEVKLRPESVPVAVLCANAAQAESLTTAWPPAARRLARAYWPGPLTIVAAGDPAVVATVRATRGIGVRVPADAVCAALLARTGPLAVTSANLHGAAPAVTADEVEAVFAVSAVAAVVDAGARDGAVSTVVDVTGGAAVVVREGAIGAADVARAVAG